MELQEVFDAVATEPKHITGPLCDGILKTLLYYDMWDHPLTSEELYAYLPINSASYGDFLQTLALEVAKGRVQRSGNYYFTPRTNHSVVARRYAKELHAHRLWKIARISMHVIKLFPFVRAVCVSGDLSKNATDKRSDIDFFIITSSHRLWITRTLLILFKKVFLLNSKKYFCLNYFTTQDHLAVAERNVYVAAEIASLQPLYNFHLFVRYLQANQWVDQFFPNFDWRNCRYRATSERRSIIQMLLELLFAFLPADRIDRFCMNKMKGIWLRRYPDLDDATRGRILRSTRSESRAFVGNFAEKILPHYEDRLRKFGLTM
jgi:hypothetical protein